MDSTYSNIFEKGASATKEQNLDMELWRLALRLQYGLRKDLEVGIEIPFFHTSGGFLDAFIQDFHRFFGLPNGGRDTVPNNQYHYEFYENGRLIYDAPSQRFNLGDIALNVKYHFLDEGRYHPALAWFAEMKFPTGRNSKGLGNGAFDFGLGLALEKSYKRIHGYLNAQYIITAADNVLDNYLRHAMLAYAAAFEVTLLDTWSVIVQLDGSTPLLTNTGIESWDGVPLDLIIGFRGCEKGLLGGHDLVWQFGFSEDVLSKGPSVDFTVFASIGIRFHRPKRVFNKDQWLAEATATQ